MYEVQRIYHINSRNRSSGTDSDMTYKIDMRDINPSHCCVLACNIPKSYYLIGENENVFTLDEGTQATITIAVGNYTRTTLKNVVITALNLASPNGWTYAISIPSASIGDNGKYTFTVTGNGGVQPDFIFTDNNIFETLGFEINSTNSFVGDSLTSVNVVKITKEDTVFIHSDICDNGNDNILQEIYTASNPAFSNIIFNTPSVDGYSRKMPTNTDNIFKIWLTNEDGEPLNLNGQNWQMTLLVYRPDNKLFRFIKDFSKLLLKK